ncbi:hypothetical protein [Bdellovibrio bacteriovorus]|uniref:Uncharacterized protein n=1 Tax=Bdellovibrio bacteriovorus TaxID=959 RepID=A0A1Z3NCP9_BDEBC|nr:hypothetical protein [Bdellovibrio bacteriovorus]ASD65244.1 hypothetical protein B9G79_17545 [Bdellovibrio bacteriovorus]
MRSLKTSLLSMLIALSFTASLARAEGETTPANTQKDAAGARKNVSDEGYTKEAKELKGLTSNIAQKAKAALAAGSKITGAATIEALDSAASYYSNLHGTCVKSQSTASWLCREKTSPELQKTLNNVNTVASMITGVAVQDACSGLAKIARLAQAGLTAYTAACSSARAACEASCSTVKNNLERINEIVTKSAGEISTCTDNPQVPGSCGDYNATVSGMVSKIASISKLDMADGDTKADQNKSIVMKDKACTYEYANMIVSAGAGIASMISSFKQGQQCDEESNGTGTDTTTTAAVDKCADATVAANDPECICKANPRTPGCSNSYQKANDGSTSRLTSQGAELGTANGKGDASTLPGIESDPFAALRDLASTNAGGSDSSGIGAPTGGGSGLSGFGGGGGGGAGAQGEAAKKGLNTDILSGSGGGGGGGGFGGFKSSDPKLRQYLPGGAKDPSQGMAGQQAWKNEVTGQGGKSNWEKIKERYRDNKNTLLNN